MTTEEKIKVMQAYVDGKQIQIKDVWGKWIDLDSEPLWGWEQSDYRIKPEEPTYRPYKDTEEMIADYKERFKANVPLYAMPLIWIKSKHCVNKALITKFCDNYVESGMWEYDMEGLHTDYCYLDGSPVGKLVE